MKIFNLTENSNLYTSNAYLVTGSMNGINDINTLIDAGRDPEIIQKIYDAPTGVGKHRIENIILTHTHYDHASMAAELKKEFKAKIYAFSENTDCVDRLLKDGDILKIGDRQFEVIHIPGHSADSICLYSWEDRVLFSGDSPVVVNSPGGTYYSEFVSALTRLANLKIERIFPGHGPVMEKCNDLISRSLMNIIA